MEVVGVIKMNVIAQCSEEKFNIYSIRMSGMKCLWQ